MAPYLKGKERRGVKKRERKTPGPRRACGGDKLKSWE